MLMVFKIIYKREHILSHLNSRKVSEQLLNTSRTRSSVARPGSVAMSTPQTLSSHHQTPTLSSRLPVSSRPVNGSGPMTPVTSRAAGQLPSNSHTGREMRPNSFAGPPNTIGLPMATPPTPATSTDQYNNNNKYQSKLPKLNNHNNYPEQNGLLSTISQV